MNNFPCYMFILLQTLFSLGASFAKSLVLFAVLRFCTAAYLTGFFSRLIMCTSWSLWDQPTTRWLQTVVASFGPLVMVLLLSWVITSETGVHCSSFPAVLQLFSCFCGCKCSNNAVSMECCKT